MKIKYIIYIVCAILLAACSKNTERTLYVDYVNPLIGTAPSTTLSALKHSEKKESNAQVVPCVSTPFGMTNWTPQTKSTETKCDAPYYYTDSIITGFRGSHWLSGSCVQDYGSFSLMPVFGDFKCLPEERGTKYSHDAEQATPYSYQVYLNEYHTNVEMTATKRCGLLRFTFDKEGLAHIVINPNSDEGEGFIRILPERNEIIGYNPVHRIYQGQGQKAGFSGYFVARFSHDFSSYGVYQGDQKYELDEQVANPQNLGGYASFNVLEKECIEVSIGTSFTSIEQARKNLEVETNGIDFDIAKNKLRDIWEEQLSKVRVEGKQEEDNVKFYTALYHSLLQPRTFNDVDGTYVSFAGGKQILNSGDSDYYVDFSMWDTYRASHPLFNLLVPEANADMMKSMFLKAEQGGWLPIFPCWNSYTSAMIGDHVIATIADAYLKGVINVTDEQYVYLLQNAFKSPETFKEYEQGKGRRALDSYLKYGYVPLEDEVLESFHHREQVSRTLEYAFDDFALYQVAIKKGDKKNAELLKQRALNYMNVYSRPDSSVRGRLADGKFTDNFDKLIRQPYITEGTPWQYTWYVPHDVKGLIDLMGGDEGFNSNLDRFHEAKQYWHGNEPGHQIPFLYNYSGQPWKTQKLVTDIMKNEYDCTVGGLSGNDDAGQMSAWYVFAAMGFYPVCPSVPEYVISGPHFDEITIQLNNGNELIIKAKGASSGKNYIQSLKVNGVLAEKNFLNHFDIINGGILEFEMGDEPNKNWGVIPECRPFSMGR
ncbi:glycoside hydrolase family 92 protein [Maribellus luteus]|uniref:Glycoside hydrolase family 92 protein n=1 Tax=Maribellus luteus TaxID=2305463 RepID=A0A399SUS9_9BACT|nr:GH92 family glycosyl hydrolase [Maribellus luteus]RIJ46464.1 glycoside hydrolase family 92 protein [Maribellus luteus]